MSPIIRRFGVGALASLVLVLGADMERMGIGVEVTLAGGVAPAPAEPSACG